MVINIYEVALMVAGPRRFVKNSLHALVCRNLALIPKCLQHQWSLRLETVELPVFWAYKYTSWIILNMHLYCKFNLYKMETVGNIIEILSVVCHTISLEDIQRNIHPRKYMCGKQTYNEVLQWSYFEFSYWRYFNLTQFLIICYIQHQNVLKDGATLANL